jgi:hypothetical protein
MSAFEPLPDQARGHRPRFFDDGASDILMAMLLELAKEQWVTKNRLATLEHWAANEVTAARTAWTDNYALPKEAEAALAAERDAFVRRLMAPVEQV